EVVRNILANLDLARVLKQLKEEIVTTNSDAMNKTIINLVKVEENFLNPNLNANTDGNKAVPIRLECMMITNLPVVPPDLRPLV
ncbi:hypothetical protein, partial [Campylobacter jejuni]|uniref:hypothetical protein n=1 Tax=Campylobacter jejuni TaxID=197 RepID=UPI00131A152D